MSADAGDPLSFLKFARQQLTVDVGAEDYLPRSLFGQYLEQLLADSERDAAPNRELSCVIDAAVDIQRQGASRWRVTLRDGSPLYADVVVLATGNPPPAALPACAELSGDARILNDPWGGLPEEKRDEEVLAIGTSLTMADVALAHLRTGRARRVHAMSRRGLLPAAQSPLSAASASNAYGLQIREAGASVRRLVRVVRELSAAAYEHGYDWRDVITEVRAQASTLWRGFDARERARFLRHVRCHWEIHRHRLPAETTAELERYRSEGRLVILAGRLREVRSSDGRLQVQWRPRGSEHTSTLAVDRIINTTGPDFDLRRLADPLWSALLRRGMVVPDALGLGARTGDRGALLDATSKPIDGLYCLGPLLRARHWETTAVAELREHARALAAQLSGPVAVAGSGYHHQRLYRNAVRRSKS
jgi:uncharacterized NAD(P)/FAD-binding protein YdhS